jgi:prevent-host-death family protein
MAKIMKSDEVRVGWRNVLDDVVAGTDILVERYGKPVVAVIPYADYMAMREELQDLRDLQAAEAAYAEYKRDPSSAVSWEELRANLELDTHTGE